MCLIFSEKNLVFSYCQCRQPVVYSMSQVVSLTNVVFVFLLLPIVSFVHDLVVRFLFVTIFQFVILLVFGMKILSKIHYCVEVNVISLLEKIELIVKVDLNHHL